MSTHNDGIKKGLLGCCTNWTKGKATSGRGRGRGSVAELVCMLSWHYDWEVSYQCGHCGIKWSILLTQNLPTSTVTVFVSVESNEHNSQNWLLQISAGVQNKLYTSYGDMLLGHIRRLEIQRQKHAWPNRIWYTCKYDVHFFFTGLFPISALVGTGVSEALDWLACQLGSPKAKKAVVAPVRESPVVEAADGTDSTPQRKDYCNRAYTAIKCLFKTSRTESWEHWDMSVDSVYTM